MKKNLFQIFLYVSTIGFCLFILLFVIGAVWIGYDVKLQCQNAIDKYHTSCVESLITLVADDTNTYRTRNSAIWALGQLGESQSLPILRQFYTGVIPSREPLNSVISQYELKKAIKLAEGGLNLTAIFWRYNIH